jgi:hypothetical protein
MLFIVFKGPTIERSVYKIELPLAMNVVIIEVSSIFGFIGKYIGPSTVSLVIILLGNIKANHLLAQRKKINRNAMHTHSPV